MATRLRKSRNLVGDVLSQSWIGIGKKAERGHRVEGVLAEPGQGLSPVHLVESDPSALRSRLLQHVGGNVDGVQLAIWQSRLKFCRNPARTGREIQHATRREAREDVADQWLFKCPHPGAAGSLMEACLVNASGMQMAARVLGKLLQWRAPKELFHGHIAARSG
jgi:hypothetical protein